MTVDRLLADVVQQRSLTEVEARQLVDGIRADVTDLDTQIATAYFGRAWDVLGYPDWDALCEGEFDGARLRVPREVRAEQVQSLRSAGLSTRAIGSALGVDQKTVVRDLASREASASPTPVTGQDGKRYASSQPPRPQTSPSAVIPAGPTATDRGPSPVHAATPPAVGEPTSPPPATTGADAPGLARGGGEPDLTGVAMTQDTGEVLSVEDWQEQQDADLDAPPANPLAAARAEVARQPAIVAGKGIERLATVRKIFDEAGTTAEIVADLALDGPDFDLGGGWLAELDRTLPILTDLASALRRRNLRSVQ